MQLKVSGEHDPEHNGQWLRSNDEQPMDVHCAAEPVDVASKRG